MICVYFTKNASFTSFGIINFADSKLLYLSRIAIATYTYYIEHCVIRTIYGTYLRICICAVGMVTIVVDGGAMPSSLAAFNG